MPMLYHLAKFVLAPVLLWQGKQVRKNVPRLPEATGERQGVVAVGKVHPAHYTNTDRSVADDNTLQVLIIGDSSAAGVGVATQAQALAGQVMAKLPNKLAPHRASQIAWQLVAQTGDTSTDIVTKLADLPPTPLDFVIVVMGVNDVTMATSVTTWQHNISNLITMLAKHQTKHIIFCALPPMHLFVALPQPLRWWLGLRATQLNRVLTTHVQYQPNCVVFTPDIPFDVKYLATDGFHPSALTYELWAEQLTKLMVNL